MSVWPDERLVRSMEEGSLEASRQLYREAMRRGDRETALSALKHHPNFTPFGDMLGVVPGITTWDEAKAQFGEFEFEEHPREGTTVLSYPRRGIFMIRSRENDTVDALYVEPPCVVLSKSGLHLGMSRALALEICHRDHHLAHDLGECFYFAKVKRGSSDFQLWFEDGALCRLKLFASL